MKAIKRKLLVLFTTVIFFVLNHEVLIGQILINEFTASNSSQIEDPDYNSNSDWLELYNAGNTAQNLQGYYLTDNFKTPDKWQITASLTIPAGGTLLFWADGNDNGNHTNFKLSADGEEIGLYSPSVQLLDSITFGVQRPDISYGRKPDGAASWGYFINTTPGASNKTTAYDGFADNKPKFSLRGGFYTSAVSVKLSTTMGGTIRYTTDGTEPSATSQAYTSLLTFQTTTVLRARIFKPNLIPGPTITNTYFINQNSVDAKLPVVSIATDPDNFWDPVKGIYVQNFKPDWEIPINIELFENNGSDRAAFNERAGCKVNGLWSWQLPQKMLGIYFKKQYGSGNLGYRLTAQRKRSSYKSFSLRASGSDWSYTMFRDILAHNSTLLNMNIEMMGYKPSVVYVNGQYMGIHNIREKVDEDYIASSYGLDKSTFDMIENEDYVENGSLDGYNEFNSLYHHDLSIDANYNVVAEAMDIEDFTDYVITEMADGNYSINHNVMAWKPKDNGKWRWILMDLDRGFFTPGDHLIDFYENQTVWPFSSLLQNDNYRNYFGKRLAAQLFTSFNPDRMKKLIAEHEKTIESEIPNHIARWQGTTSNYGDAMPSVDYWYNQVDNLVSYVEQRPAALLNDLRRYGFSGTVNLSLVVSPAEAGVIKLDGLTVPESSCSGLYLDNVDIELTAVNKPGYEFSGWAAATSSTLIPKGSQWKYFDSGTDLSNTWITSTFDDSSWKTGLSEFGYGDGDEATTVSYGSDSQNKYVTTYFRRKFTVSDAQKQSGTFSLNLLFDDGAIVYLNGKEVVRANMAAGNVTYQTLAASSVSGQAESSFTNYTLNADDIVTGENMIAVEVHQGTLSSTDLSFDLELVANVPNTSSFISTNPVLTQHLSGDKFLMAVYKQSSQCILPEIISANTTLSKDCSPYLAQGDITILKDATLTIDPGVEIWMPEGACIYVNGVMNAMGTADGEITFKYNPMMAQGYWGAILFKNTPQKSNLNYVTIEDASAGPDPVLDIAAISAFYADLNLDNLIIDNVQANPITARYSDVALTNSRLHSIITGDCINIKYGKGRVENCIFNGSDEPDADAIDFDEVQNGIIKNCEISAFRGSNSDAVDLGEQAYNISIDSIIVHNVFDKGVSVGQQSTATVQNSVFINCGIGVALKDSSDGVINRCVFYGVVDAIACYEKNVGDAGGNAIVTNCILSNSPDNAFFVDNKSTLQSKYCLTDCPADVKYANNLSGNPQFTDPTFFDFSLMAASPAIDAGFENGNVINLGAVLSNQGFKPDVMITQIFVNGEGLNFPEFITLYNPSNEAVDVSNYAITKGVTAVIPEGTLLAPNDILYLTANAKFSGWWKQNKQIIQWESGKLSDNGEAIQLEDGKGIVIDYVNYQDDGTWPQAAFYGINAFQLKSPNLDNHFGENWDVTSIDLILDTTQAPDAGEPVVYPNPTKGVVTVKALDHKSQGFKVINFAGQVVHKMQLDKNGYATMDLSDLPSGIYLVNVSGSVHKLIKL